jgi:hypothetical protein
MLFHGSKIKDWRQIVLYTSVMKSENELKKGEQAWRQIDKIWDDYQQELINAGVEKMEKGFTKYVQDRVKL